MAHPRSRCCGDSGFRILRNAAGCQDRASVFRQERRYAQRRGGTPMSALRVSLIQGATRWHDPAGNRDYYEKLLAPLRGQTDLCVLPETFTSGFSNEAIHNAETMEGPTIEWIREQARKLDAAVTGSVQLRVGD